MRGEGEGEGEGDESEGDIIMMVSWIEGSVVKVTKQCTVLASDVAPPAHAHSDRSGYSSAWHTAAGIWLVRDQR